MTESLSTLFVYGLFRPGANNWSTIHKDVREIIGDVRISGRMYYDISYLYPVTDFDETDHEVVGDIIKLTSEKANWITRLEMNSGYQPRTLNIDNVAGKTYTVTAFHWPHLQRGMEIQNGDWMNSADSLIN